MCATLIMGGIFINKKITSKAATTDNIDVSWIDPSKKLVAFAFDDGPVANSSSNKILNALKTNNCHATFFYIGRQINGSTRSEISTANNQGCEVANHTYTHPYLTNMSSNQIKDEVNKTANELKSITGKSEFLLRPPYLATNQTVSSSVGCPMITCSLDTGDWNNGNYNSVLNKIKSAKDGDILLMHENYDFTASAVESAIPYLKQQGFEIVSVSELFKMKGKTPYNGQIYSNCTGSNVTTYYKGGSSSNNTGNTSDTPSNTDVNTSSKIQCSNMKLQGQYAGSISSPFNGVALYANDDKVTFTHKFTKGTNSFSLRGCSNNNNMARVDLKIDGQYKGTFYYGGSYPAVYTINNVNTGTGNKTVELVVTADDGNWDAFVDYLEIK